MCGPVSIVLEPLQYESVPKYVCDSFSSTQGHSVSGASNTSDFVNILMRGLIELGVVPGLKLLQSQILEVELDVFSRFSRRTSVFFQPLPR